MWRMEKPCSVRRLLAISSLKSVAQVLSSILVMVCSRWCCQPIADGSGARPPSGRLNP